jgi:hypothetical protein
MALTDGSSRLPTETKYVTVPPTTTLDCPLVKKRAT